MISNKELELGLTNRSFSTSIILKTYWLSLCSIFIQIRSKIFMVSEVLANSIAKNWLKTGIL